MAVTIDFGNFAGVNMLRPGALGKLVLSRFDGFDFLTGGYDPVIGELEIPSTSNTAAYVLAFGNWGFTADGTPSDASTVHAIEVWDSRGYRIVIDGFDVFFPTLRNALEGKNLSSLYAGHELEILGAESFSDTLAGGALDDEIYGYGGHDVLIGNAGNDYLDGMGGRDTMTGGRGNDDYAVNHADDVIVEQSAGGIDLAVASLDYTLPAFVEDLALLDAGGALDGVGNGHGNFMAGNASANRLAGLRGNDTLVGLAGPDVLDGGAGADRLFGEEGNDTLVWDEADVRVDGGGSNDVLRLRSDLDLRGVANGTIVDFERIDMRGGADVLTLNQREVLEISSTTDVLRVLGDVGDTVDVTSAFTQRGDVDGFTRYDVGRATLWIDSDIQVI